MHRLHYLNQQMLHDSHTYIISVRWRWSQSVQINWLWKLLLSVISVFPIIKTFEMIKIDEVLPTPGFFSQLLKAIYLYIHWIALIRLRRKTKHWETGRCCSAWPNALSFNLGSLANKAMMNIRWVGFQHLTQEDQGVYDSATQRDTL